MFATRRCWICHVGEHGSVGIRGAGTRYGQLYVKCTYVYIPPRITIVREVATEIFGRTRPDYYVPRALPAQLSAVEGIAATFRGALARDPCKVESERDSRLPFARPRLKRHWLRRVRTVNEIQLIAKLIKPRRTAMPVIRNKSSRRLKCRRRLTNDQKRPAITQKSVPSTISGAISNGAPAFSCSGGLHHFELLDFGFLSPMHLL